MNLTAPSHKLDCFLHKMLLITDSFFHKIKFTRTFKKCSLSGRFGCRKCFFSMIIKRLLSARTAKDIQHLQPAIDVSRIWALSIYEKNSEISVVAKVEFPIGKKLFHLVGSPGTWRGARPWTWNWYKLRET